MNEENQKLTLGEVKQEDLKFSQPDVIQDDLTEYYNNTDIPTIMEDFRRDGTEPDVAMRLLKKRGFDPDEVQGQMTTHYEEKRKEFLKQQEEDRKRQEESQRRIDEMSANTDLAVPEGQEQMLDVATEDEYGQPVSIARPEIAKVYQSEGILGDPFSPTSLPKDLVEAMNRGEDPTLRYQSYQNDRDVYDTYAQHGLATELHKAIQNKDVDSYNSIAGELSDYGFFVQEVDNLDQDDYSDVQRNLFDGIEQRKNEVIDERNKINSQFGLPSGFNPESDVDFLYAMRESLERQHADFESSDYSVYMDEVETAASAMLERSDTLDSIIFGKDSVLDDFGGKAIEGVIQGVTKKFMMPLVQAATVGLPSMYYDGLGALDSALEQMGVNSISNNKVREGQSKMNAKMQSAKKLNDAIAMERSMRLMQRGLSKEEASLGVSELFGKMTDGEVGLDKFVNRISYEVAEGFGQAIGYMIPIGRASKALNTAKAMSARAAAGAAGKSVPKGIGLLTGEAAASARAIDAASKASKALTAANRQYNAVFTALGVSSAAGFYQDLYDRKDLSFSEKMVQSTIVGVAEATLGKLFSNVDAMFVGGARGMAKAAAINDIKKMAEQKLKQLTTRSGLKKGLGVTAKGITEEFAEEFGVELVGQAVSIINDVAMGRKPQDLNWHQLIDAGLAGMFGAGPTSVMAGIGTFQAHNSFLKERRALTDDLGKIQDEIDSETDPQRRKDLMMLRDGLSAQIMKIDGDSKKAFNKMSEGQRRRLLKIHRDMAYTENRLKSSDITKEEREQLKSRYENLVRAKVKIENTEAEVEPDYASEDEDVVAQDAAGNDVETPTSIVTRQEKNTQKNVQDATEPAPAGQEQEAVQLSLFDETQEDQFEEETHSRIKKAIQEEAPVTEEAPVEQDTAEPAQEKAAEPVDDSEYDEFSAEGLIDVTDTEQVGEEGRMTLDQALQTNALGRSLGNKLTQDGFKIRKFKTRAAFNRAQKLSEDDRFSGGFVDPDTKTINLAPDATAREIQEEFAHAAFRDILGEAAPQRRELYLYLEELKQTNSGVEKAFRDVNKAYEGSPQAEIEEEVIVEVLLKYAEGSLTFNREERTSVRMLVNSILDFFGVYTQSAALKNDKEFKEFADGFKMATRGQGRVDPRNMAPKIQRTESFSEQDTARKPEESDQQYRERLERVATEGMGEAEGTTVSEEDAMSQGTEDITTTKGIRSSKKRKTEFNYLKDTEVFYTEDPYVDVFGVPQASRSRSKKIKVNDYFHFRNWYNYMNANGRRDRVMGMYFIKDGKKYKINPPKPKTDRDGNLLNIKYAENEAFAVDRRKQQRASDAARNKKAAEKEVFDFGREADEILKRVGFPSSGGMVFVPGFDVNEFTSISDPNERFSFQTAFKREMFNKPPEQQQEILEIARLNLDALRASGMSVGEIEAADKAKIFNMTGLVPAHMAKSGDSTNKGSIRRSKKRKSQPTSQRVISMATKRGGILGKLSDFAGVIARNIGYDVSSESIGSGLMNQFNQRFKIGDRDVPILSSHIDVTYAASLRKRILEMAQEDLARPESERKGYVMLTFSTLEIESIGGNPQVFQLLIQELQEKGDNPVDLVNELLMPTSEGGVLANVLYKKLATSRIITENTSVQDKFDNSLDVGARAKVDTAEEAMTVLKALAEVRSEEGGFDTSFDARSTVAKRMADKLKEEGQKRSDYLEKFADKSLLSTRMGGAVMAGIKVPYKITEDGKADISHIVRRRLSDEDVSKVVGRGKSKGPFDGFLVNTMEPGEVPNKYYGKEFTEDDGKMIVFDEQVPLGDAYPSATKFDEGTNKFEPRFSEDPEKRLKQEKGAAARGVSAVLLDDRTVDHRVEERNQQRNRRSSKKRGAQTAFELVEETGFQKWKNKWIRRLQDKYIDIFNIQESIEKQTGKLSADKDFRMAEELMYGKAAEDLAKLDKMVEGITADMKKAGIKVSELSEYMYALHAKERNTVISERSNGAITDGSGMSDQEADAILNSANKAALDPIVNKVREIQNDTRATMVKFGLETKETVDAFESMFENYVPLAGRATDETTGSQYPTGGAGMNVFGPTTRRATGRQSQAVNVVAQIVAQNAGVHVKARTNEALGKLYNLIEENPNSKVWRILGPNQVTDPNSPNVVALRVDGKQKFIYFRDASYAETLRGMNLPQSNAFVRALRAPAQWLRASFTTLNPEFVISNFSRDIQSAIFNAAAEAEIEGGMLNSPAALKRIFTLVPQTVKTLVKNSVQKGGDPAIEKYFQEFKEDGGKTGWAYAKPLDQLASELETGAEGKTKTQEILGKAKNFAEFIEGINDAFENSIRLASYIAARENGVSREKAAQLGKNITVNFNKQGEWGPTLNAVYLFFNASVQGTARLGRSLTNLRPQKRPDGTDRNAFQRVTSAQWMAAGLGLFSSMLTMLGYAVSDEDEDGIPYWDKIPDYVKERNLVIMRPNGKDYFKIPMPYGFNVFANMGTAMTESAYGGREADEAMMFLFNSFMASFSPVSFGQSDDLFKAIGKGAVPTVIKPFADVMVNETYFGGPVTGENLPFGVQRPDSELSFRSPESVQDMFKWINEATGGSEYKSGDLDFNPDKFWYMFEYYIGGAGQFVNRSLFKFPKQLKSKIFSDEDIQIQSGDVPVLRLLYGQPNKYFDFEKFKENEQEFKSLYKEAKESPKLDDLSRYKGISPKTNSLLNKIKKQMTMLRKAQYEARKIDDYSKRTARIQDLKNKERTLIMKWNKFYENARK